ncbi:TPA: hypothetical protein ACHFP9_000169 [Enterobacter hormaechei]
MTNVSAVEKMAELMQQMEENSPRVSALQYCLTQLEAKCSALAAENVLLKKSEPAPFSKLMMEALDVYQAGADEVPELAMLSAYKKLRDGLKIPATDAFLAEVRASAIEHAASERWGSGYVFDELNNFADQLRKGVQS